LKVIVTGKKDQKGKFIADDPALFSVAFAPFKVGDQIDVTIEKHRTKRTTQQNAYLWGHVYKEIATAIGVRDLEEVHDIMKLKFNSEMRIVKVTQVNKSTGETRVVRKRVKVPMSTTILTPKEFGEYIESIREWAANFLSLNIQDARSAGY